MFPIGSNFMSLGASAIWAFVYRGSTSTLNLSFCVPKCSGSSFTTPPPLTSFFRIFIMVSVFMSSLIWRFSSCEDGIFSISFLEIGIHGCVQKSNHHLLKGSHSVGCRRFFNLFIGSIERSNLWACNGMISLLALLFSHGHIIGRTGVCKSLCQRNHRRRSFSSFIRRRLNWSWSRKPSPPSLVCSVGQICRLYLSRVASDPGG